MKWIENVSACSDLSLWWNEAVDGLPAFMQFLMGFNESFAKIGAQILMSGFTIVLSFDVNFLLIWTNLMLRLKHPPRSNKKKKVLLWRLQIENCYLQLAYLSGLVQLNIDTNAAGTNSHWNRWKIEFENLHQYAITRYKIANCYSFIW